MKAKKYPTQERIKELFTYENGNLFWREKPSKRIKKGSLAGVVNGRGYNIIRCFGLQYQTHRLIWIYFNGNVENQSLDIDHINQIRSDNRIDNLRLITHSKNLWNSDKAKGYCFSRGRYVARINVNYKSIYLGHFDIEQEARNAYLKAKEKYHIIEVI